MQGKEAAGIILFSTPTTIKCSYAVPVGKTLWTEVIIPSQWSKPINGVRPPEHRQRHLLQKAGACRAHSGPLVDNSRRMLRPSGGFSIYLCLPRRSAGFSVLLPHSPCLDSEGLSIDPFGFYCSDPGGLGSPTLCQCIRVIMRSPQLRLLSAYGGQAVPISRLHLKEDSQCAAATQYLSTAPSGSPGWDPGQAPPPLPGGRRLLMALPTSWFIKDLFCGVAIKINRRPESQGTKNQLRRNRNGGGAGVGGKRGLGFPKTRFPWQPASKIVWE